MVTAFLFTATPSELPFLLSGQEFTPRFYLASGQTRCCAGKHCQTDPSPGQVIRRTNSSFLTHGGGCQGLSLLFSASWLRKGYVQSKRVACPPRAAWETVQIPAGSRAGLGRLSAGCPAMGTGDNLCPPREEQARGGWDWLRSVRCSPKNKAGQILPWKPCRQSARWCCRQRETCRPGFEDKYLDCSELEGDYGARPGCSGGSMGKLWKQEQKLSRALCCSVCL